MSPNEYIPELLKEHGITKPPVNVYQIIHEEGFALLFRRFPKENEDVSGMCCTLKGTTHIFINTINKPERQRFTAAHELKHAIFEPQLNHASLGSDQLRAVEQEADSFSANLLMPAPMVRHMIREFGFVDPYLMKLAFGVSITAAVVRLTNLGHFPALRVRAYLQDVKNQKARALTYARQGTSALPLGLQDWPALYAAVNSMGIGPVARCTACKTEIAHEVGDLCWWCAERRKR